MRKRVARIDRQRRDDGQRTGLALLATVSGPEIRLVLGLILAGAAAAVLPAWRAHRQPVASLLSG